MMGNDAKKLGDLGEKIAIGYLQRLGHKIMQLNYRCKFGEIDIVSCKKGTYIFVEVKTRRNLSFGRPIEAITYKKKMHLLKTGQYYMQVFNLKDRDFRFDAIEILVLSDKTVKINYIENILQ